MTFVGRFFYIFTTKSGFSEVIPFHRQPRPGKNSFFYIFTTLKELNLCFNIMNVKLFYIFLKFTSHKILSPPSKRPDTYNNYFWYQRARIFNFAPSSVIFRALFAFLAREHFPKNYKILKVGKYF